MRRGILYIIILFSFSLAASLSGCQNGPGTKVPHDNMSSEKKSPGKIVFDKEIHIFGTLKEGEIVSYSFIFHNTGGSAVKLIKVEKSCGCIDLNYSKNDVLPGESSTIEVVLNSSGEWGNLIREVTLETSNGEKKELQIGAYIENSQFNTNLNTEK